MLCVFRAGQNRHFPACPSSAGKDRIVMFLNLWLLTAMAGIAEDHAKIRLKIKALIRRVKAVLEEIRSIYEK